MPSQVPLSCGWDTILPSTPRVWLNLGLLRCHLCADPLGSSSDADSSSVGPGRASAFLSSSRRSCCRCWVARSSSKMLRPASLTLEGWQPFEDQWRSRASSSRPPAHTPGKSAEWPRVTSTGLSSSAEPGFYPTLPLGHPCSLQPSPKWVPHADCVVGPGDAAANGGDKALCPSSLHPNWERGTVDTDST